MEQTPLVIDFDDNSLLPPLFGEHDRHLARIEQVMGVSLVPRGNRLAIIGEPIAMRAAKAAIDDLYQRLKQGLDVGNGEVDGAIRMAEALGPEVDARDAKRRSTSADDTIVNTQKRVITPRSPTQAAYVRALRDSEMVLDRKSVV